MHQRLDFRRAIEAWDRYLAPVSSLGELAQVGGIPPFSAPFARNELARTAGAVPAGPGCRPQPQRGAVEQASWTLSDVILRVVWFEGRENSITAPDSTRPCTVAWDFAVYSRPHFRRPWRIVVAGKISGGLRSAANDGRGNFL